MNNKINYIVIFLGAYQIFGGILGIALGVRILPQITDISMGNVAVTVAAGLLYLYSVICGLVLFMNQKKGLNLSLINQVLQVLSLTVGSFAYNYVAGFKAGFGIDFVPVWQLKLNLSISSFRFVFNTETGGAFIGINLLALLLVYLIERLKEKVG